ncbi:MAG: acylphosphatase [Deltaproteobacteria bacterium]|nr:acylphosphatase [Deltaproteobacteria bacterium]
MTEKVRARIIISGIVQGVFFRVETQRAAQRYGVNGWVRNKSDGTVEAVIEGERHKVDGMLNWCRKGPPRAVVSQVDVEWGDYTGAMADFRVTR